MWRKAQFTAGNRIATGTEEEGRRGRKLDSKTYILMLLSPKL